MKRATTRAKTAFHARLRRVVPMPTQQAASEQPSRSSRVSSRWTYGFLMGALLTCGGVLLARNYPGIDTFAAVQPQRLIGPTTTVTEVSTGLPFAARVDTGATTCAIHCEAVEIEDADPDPKKNIGKPVRFLVKNKTGESKWVE